eukprot:9475872-Pyramimonas_sp.AAC.1
MVAYVGGYGGGGGCGVRAGGQYGSAASAATGDPGGGHTRAGPGEGLPLRPERGGGREPAGGLTTSLHLIGPR